MFVPQLNFASAELFALEFYGGVSLSTVTGGHCRCALGYSRCECEFGFHAACARRALKGRQSLAGFEWAWLQPYRNWPALLEQH